MSEKPERDLVDNFNNIFDDFFRQAGHYLPPRPATRPAAQFTVSVHVTPEECAAGIEKEIVYQWMDVCKRCDTTGAEPGAPPAVVCSRCQGSGQVRTVKQTFLGAMVHFSPCTVCKGAGKYSPKPCRECHARGYVPQKSIYHLYIPVGTLQGAQFPVPGIGDIIQPGGTRGDITFVVDVAANTPQDPRKKKKKNDESLLGWLKRLFGLD